MDLDRYFQKSDLIPAIVQEQGTGQVLMLAYMNRESLQKTFETGYTVPAAALEQGRHLGPSAKGGGPAGGL